ncbi:MAG: GNAT family N-acetyltransferase [Saprospiraceae bacterium]
MIWKDYSPSIPGESWELRPIGKFKMKLKSYRSTVFRKKGIGTSLLNEIIKKGTAEGYKRIWLVTTNDNTNALRFYQKRGWNLKALYLDSVLEARKLKTQHT